MELVLQHGSFIVEENGLQYIGGESTIMEYDFNIDLLSYLNVLSYVKELGYSRIGGVYYRKKVGGDIINIEDNKDILLYSVS